MLMGALIGCAIFGLWLAAGNLYRAKGDNLGTLAFMTGALIFLASSGAIIGSLF